MAESEGRAQVKGGARGMPGGARKYLFFGGGNLAKENSEEAPRFVRRPPLFFQWESMREVLTPSPAGFVCAVVEKSKEKLSNDP